MNTEVRAIFPKDMVEYQPEKSDQPDFFFFLFECFLITEAVCWNWKWYFWDFIL